MSAYGMCKTSRFFRRLSSFGERAAALKLFFSHFRNCYFLTRVLLFSYTFFVWGARVVSNIMNRNHTCRVSTIDLETPRSHESCSLLKKNLFFLDLQIEYMD
jgi:hypothetical protein